jgi:hypothetical protein
MVQEMAFNPGNLSLAFAGSNGPKSELGKRVLRILSPNRSKINTREKYSAISIVAILLLFLSIAAKPNYKPKEETGFNLSSLDSENFDYLKYDNEGKLDSLYLPSKIQDGEYTYQDELQNVLITIKNNYVTKFNINGLQVEGKDISKFTKIIYRAIASNKNLVSQDSETSSETTFLGDGQIMVKDENQKSILLIDEKGGNKLKIEVNNCKPILFEYNNNKLYKDGKLATNDELKEMGWYIDDEAGIQPINGFTNIQPIENMDSEELRMEEESYLQDMKQHELDMKQHEKDMKQHEYDMKQHELDIKAHEKLLKESEKAISEQEYLDENLHSINLNETLINQIIKYITDKNYFTKGKLFFNINFVNGMVNEKLLNKEDHKYIVSMIEKKLRIKIGKSDHIEFSRIINDQKKSFMVDPPSPPKEPSPKPISSSTSESSFSTTTTTDEIKIDKQDLKFQQRIEDLFIEEGLMNKNNFSYFILNNAIEVNEKKVESRIVKKVM